MYAKDVVSLLSELLERRHQYHEKENSCRALSKNEVEILCLLLEVVKDVPSIFVFFGSIFYI